jgi:hypothetical protein
MVRVRGNGYHILLVGNFNWDELPEKQQYVAKFL